MGRKISMREARQIALDNLERAEGERLESVNFEEGEECVRLRAEVARLKEEITYLRKLYDICVELDMEMDGVKAPASAAGLLNAMRRIIEAEDGSEEE